jgi:hypothetical protein
MKKRSHIVQATEWANKADALARDGKMDDAAKAYARAARHTEEAIAVTPDDKPKTRSVLRRNLSVLRLKEMKMAEYEMDWATMIAVSRPAETTVIRLWHWAVNPDDPYISCGEGISGTWESVHPTSTLKDALKQLTEIVMREEQERWTLRAVIVTGSQLIDNLSSVDGGRDLMVHPISLCPIVTFDRGGSAEYHVADIPARKRATIDAACARAWRSHEADIS